MTAEYAQEPIEYPSAPIEGDTKATVELVGNDWLADEDWAAFCDACIAAAHFDFAGLVNPNHVRSRLSNTHGLTIEPRRYSSFWSRAASKNGFLTADGWVINDDVKGGNRGKPLRRYRLRVTA